MNNQLLSRPFAAQRAFAFAVVCALAGGAALWVLYRATGSYLPSLLVLAPTVVAWYVGTPLALGAVAIELLVALLTLPPAYSLRVASPDDAERAVVAAMVSALVVVLMGRFRRIEQRYRRIVELASEGVWLIDADGRTTFANQCMADMLGYTPAEMLGRRFSDFVPQEELEAAEQGFETRKHGVTERMECRLVRKDGSIIWTQWAATPTSEGGVFTGAFALLTDITQRKRDEEIIRRQGDELKRLNRQKDRSLAMLSHELRNPLGSIVAALKLMDIKGGDAFGRERAVIRRQTEHLRRLVDDLLDLSRFAHGGVTIKREPVNLCAVVEQAIESAAGELATKSLQVDAQVPRTLVVKGDHERLVQVATNLLTNAARYTHEGGEISVSVGVDGTNACLHVRDNGAGIAAGFIHDVFEPFARGNASASEHGGLGVGLAIVQGIVRSHGGTVTVHSEGEGRGAEFIVRLPIEPDDTAAQAQ